MRPILFLSILLLTYSVTPTLQVYLNDLNGIKWIQAQNEYKWVPAKPMNLMFNVTAKDSILEVTVTLVFNHGGYRVENKTQEVSGGELRGYIDVAMWTGPSIQVVTYRNVTYTFTNLGPGEYVFKLYINNDLSGQIIVKIRGDMVTVTAQQIPLTPTLAVLVAILLILVLVVTVKTLKAK